MASPAVTTATLAYGAADPRRRRRVVVTGAVLGAAALGLLVLRAYDRSRGSSISLSATVTVHVVDAETGRAVEGVVVLFPGGSATPTDSAGRWERFVSCNASLDDFFLIERVRFVSPVTYVLCDKDGYVRTFAPVPQRGTTWRLVWQQATPAVPVEVELVRKSPDRGGKSSAN